MPQNTKSVFYAQKFVSKAFSKAKLNSVLKPEPSQKKNLIFNCEKKRILTRYRSVISDQNRRSAFEIRELENQVLKSVLRMNSPQAKVDFERLLLSPKIRGRCRPRGSLTRIRNRCVLSGHRTSLGTYGLSRIKFRQLAGLGCLPGVFKI